MASSVDIIYRTTYDGRGARQAKGDLDNTTDAVKRQGGSYDGLKRQISGLVTTYGTLRAAQELWTSAMRGAGLEKQRDQFERLALSVDSTADAMLGKLREATRGMIADADLIASASGIISLGLGKTEDDVIRLATVVGGLGLDMQQVILTFANNSKARLDALGLSVEGVENRVKELEDAGFEGDAFDQAVLLELEERYKLLADGVGEADREFKILQANAKNLKDEFDRLNTETLVPLIVLLNDLADASSNGADKQEALADFMGGKFRETLARVDPLLASMLLRQWALNDAVDYAAEQSLVEAAEFAGMYASEMEGLDDALGDTTDALSKNEIALRGMREETEYGARATGELAEEVEEVEEQLTKEGEALRNNRGPKADWVRITDEQKEAAEKYEEAMRELTGALGDYFDEAINAEEAPDLAQMLYDAANAAGASAGALGLLGIELGLFSEAEALAALKAALMHQEIQRVAELVAGGMSIPDAMQHLQDFQDELDGAQTSLKTLADGKYNINITDNADSVGQRLQGLLDSLNNLDGKTANVFYNVNQSGPKLPGTQQSTGGATGGTTVSGPGGQENYAHGGFTGYGGTSTVAGYVHANELVIPYGVRAAGMGAMMDFIGSRDPMYKGGSTSTRNININITGGDGRSYSDPLLRSAIIDAVNGAAARAADAI